METSVRPCIRCIAPRPDGLNPLRWCRPGSLRKKLPLESVSSSLSSSLDRGAEYGVAATLGRPVALVGRSGVASSSFSFRLPIFF